MLRALLSLVSVGYRLGRWGHRLAYLSGFRRRVRLSVPVVSVGNITTGGVGKTPVCAWLAREFRRRGRVPVVLARGYGREAGETLNDEGRWLEHSVPGLTVVQDADRVSAIRPVLERGESDVVILDDGFQHERLERDLDLVLLDATRPFGFGRLLPRGLLRDPLPALARADLIVLTRCELCSGAELARLESEVERWAPGRPVARIVFSISRLDTSDGPRPPSDLEGRSVLLMCGVGNPRAVVRTVQALGVESVELWPLPDHGRPSPTRWEEARRQAAAAGQVLVLTEKDAVKLPEGAGGAWVLVQEAEWTAGRERLDHLLGAVLGEDGRAG